MALKHSYALLAPIYDAMVSGPLESYRKKSLLRLADEIKSTSGNHIFINGIGSGLDIPYLPDNTRYTGTDITPAMLQRAQNRASDASVDIQLQIADSQALPFEDDSFDVCRDAFNPGCCS